jgi:peptidylprolyl isomerase
MLLLAVHAALAATWPVADQAADAVWKTWTGGLQTQDLVVGDGPTVVDGADVEVHYTGMLEDGTVFDSSVPRGETFRFRVGAQQVIAGWDQGLAGMAVGGKRRLMIPSELGYGDRGAGSIPPGATLYFEVELLGLRAPRTPPAAPREAITWRRGPRGLEVSELAIGAGEKIRKGERACIDLEVWAGDALIHHTYSKPECWWIRYDHTLVMEGLTLGMKGMRAGGARQLRVPPELAVTPAGDAMAAPPGVTLLVDVTVIEAAAKP